MGQNPVSPRPGMGQQPPWGPSGPSSGQGYGYQGPQGPAQGPQSPPGPQSPMASPAYPASGPAPVRQAPYASTGQGPYQAPGAGGTGPGYPYAGVPNQVYPGTGLPPAYPPAKKKGGGLLVGLVAGLVGLVLVVGAVVAVVLITAQAAPVSTEPDKATTSVAALQGYLDALAAGDADKAKLYAMNAPADSPLLTNDFLKATVAKSPVTEIQVDKHKDVGTTAYVNVTYKLGSTLVQGSYELTKVAKIWKLNTIVTTVNRPSYWGKLGVMINGTAAPAAQISLFPGVYQLATGTTLLSFDQATFTVDQPSNYVSGFSSSQPVLTDAGKKLMISQAQAWLTSCLAVQDTNPKDCGMNTPLPSGATLAPGSLKRTVDSTAPAFSDATPRVSYDDPTKVTMTSYVPIKITAADTAGNTYSGTASVSSAVGTIKGETITVTFTE